LQSHADLSTVVSKKHDSDTHGFNGFTGKSKKDATFSPYSIAIATVEVPGIS